MRFAFWASVVASVAVSLVACSSETSSTSPGGSTGGNPPGTTQTPGTDGGSATSDGATATPDAFVRVKPTQSTLTVSGTDPATGDGTMNIQSVQADRMTGGQSDRVRVRVTGSTGNKMHLVTVVFFADTGQMSSITHQWADSLNDVFQADGVAYCDALGVDQPVCTGLFHDPSQRYFTIKAAKLKGKFPGNNPTASQLDGAILYPAW